MELKTSHTFRGTIWNILSHPDRDILFIETREEQAKQVLFSAWDMRSNQFLWREITFEEPWWISLAAVAGNILLLTIYTDTNNPDKKSVIAFDIDRQCMVWWKNDFSISTITNRHIIGTESKFGLKNAILNINDGQPAVEVPDSAPLQNFSLLRPLQYLEGAGHFDTVKSFLESKIAISPLMAIEYLEYRKWILISCYLQESELANYLYVFSTDGTLLLKERIGERLKGIGADTFFILSGYLIFVKNKCELVSYSMV